MEPLIHTHSLDSLSEFLLSRQASYQAPLVRSSTHVLPLGARIDRSHSLPLAKDYIPDPEPLLASSNSD